MDNAHTAGPQIRSRITVVCAECKRLKLRCDRRNPCGSCTKRDTVVRCQYSPAAVDKVDLHSLNNRLLQVESTLALITAGQTPPAFQPTYPISVTPSGPPTTLSTQTAHHHHHHHYSVTPSSSQSLALSDTEIASIWLDDILPYSSHLKGKQRLRDPQKSIDGVKLEPSIVDVDLIGDAHESGSGGATSIFARPTSLHRSSDPQPHLYRPLPTFSIYYPAPAPSDAPSHPDASYPPYNGSTSGGAFILQPSNRDSSKPQITPALLTLLPPPDRCRDLLTRAKHHFRLRPVPFLPSCFFPSPEQAAKKKRAVAAEGSTGGAEADEGELEDEEAWRVFEKRCWSLLGIEPSSEKEKEKERIKEEKRRARQIYFAGYNQEGGAASAVPESPTGRLPPPVAPPSNTPVKQEESVPFFALLCVVLAVGTLNAPTTSPTAGESGEFLYNLSQQAIGVWDTHISTALPTSSSSSTSAPATSTPSAGGPSPFAVPAPPAPSIWTAKEKDELDKAENLLACLVGVVYVLSARRESLRTSVSLAEPVADDPSSASEGTSGGEWKLQGAVGEEEETKRREKERISVIIGKLVNAARSLGLGKDAPSRSGTASSTRSKAKSITATQATSVAGPSNPNLPGSGPTNTPSGFGAKDTAAAARKEAKENREEKKEEWRRIVWWDVLFYDLFAADALGQQPLLPAYSYSVRSLPTAPNPSSNTAMQPPPVPSADPVGASATQRGFVGDEDPSNAPASGQQPPSHNQDTSTSKAVRPAAPARRSRKAYLIARCRLTSLAQRILHALAHPSCCCGYTIDQALALEAELRAWSLALAPCLKLDVIEMKDSSSTSSANPRLSPGPQAARKHDVWKIHAAELQLLFNLLTLKIWSPFITRLSTSNPNASSMTASTAATMSNQASIASIGAAVAIMRCIKNLTSSPKASSAVTSFSFFSPSKILWDSLVICASALISPPSTASSSSFLSDGGASTNLPSIKDLHAHMQAGLNDLVALVSRDDSLGAAPSLKDRERVIADDIQKMVTLGVGLSSGTEGKWSTLPGSGPSMRRDSAQSTSEGKAGMKRKHDQVEAGPPTPIRGAPGVSLAYGSNDDAATFDYTSDFAQAHEESEQPSYSLADDHSQPFTTTDRGYQQHDVIAVDQPQAAAQAFVPHGPSVAASNASSAPPNPAVYGYATNATTSHVATSNPSMSQTPHSTMVNPYPPQPRGSHEQEEQPDLSVAIQSTVRAKRTSGSSSSEKDKADKDKSRRKSPVYPSVGVRVRVDKEGYVARPRSGTHAPSATSPTKGSMQAPGPLMTSTPRPLPSAMNATAERIFQLRQRQKEMSTSPPDSHGDQQPQQQQQQQQHQHQMPMDPYRSRSSSLSLGLGPMTSHAPQPTTQQRQQPQPQQAPSSDMEYANYGMLDMEVQHHQLEAEEQQHQHAYQPSHHPLPYEQPQQASLYQPSPQQPPFDLSQDHLIDEFQNAARRRYSNTNTASNNAPSYANASYPNQISSPFSTSSGGSPFGQSGNTAHNNQTPPGHGFGVAPHMTPAFGPHLPPSSSSHAAPQPTPTPQLPAAASNSSDVSSNPSESPTGYFHDPNRNSSFATGDGNSTSYATSAPSHAHPHPHPHLHHPQSHHRQDMTVAMLESQSAMAMEGIEGVPRTPIYDKGVPHQRPPAGGMHHHHVQGGNPHPHQPPSTPGSLYGHSQQQLHTDPGGGGPEFQAQGEQLDMMMGVAGASASGGWSQTGGMPQQHLHTHQPISSPHPSQAAQPPFWNTGPDFKFFA